MSNSKHGGEAPPDDPDDGSDVTEIVPPSKPASESGDAEATQILSVQSSVTPTQPLPGTVIGVVGAGKTDHDAAKAAPADIAQPDAETSNEDDATRILFNSPQETPATQESQSIGKTSGQDDKPTTPDDGHVGDAEATSDSDDEKTVFVTAAMKSQDQDDFSPPVGWLVIVDGPGRGAVLDIHYGQNTIGRGEDCLIRFNFGDTQITRETHAFILYDELERTFFLRDAGKKNLVRINKTPVMTPTQLNSHDQIQIGKTTCLFVPLCNDVFDWLGGEDDPATGPPEEDKPA